MIHTTLGKEEYCAMFYSLYTPGRRKIHMKYTVRTLCLEKEEMQKKLCHRQWYIAANSKGGPGCNIDSLVFFYSPAVIFSVQLLNSRSVSSYIYACGGRAH